MVFEVHVFISCAAKVIIFVVLLLSCYMIEIFERLYKGLNGKKREKWHIHGELGEGGIEKLLSRVKKSGRASMFR